MIKLFGTELFFIFLVIFTYTCSLFIYRKTELTLLHPILFSISVLIIFLKVFDIEYVYFREQCRVIDFFLGPSVVAIGYSLNEQFEHIKLNMVSILTSIVTGSFIGIVSIMIIAKFFNVDHVLVATLVPKSVTTPIAMEISKNYGGIPELSAVIVVLVGIFGAVAGPFILRKTGIENKLAIGLALGAASHGIGTARAIQLGMIEGAISGLAIGLMGVATTLWMPIIYYFINFTK
jgi:predicted murein hydrolase (TIGR00659 family)